MTIELTHNRNEQPWSGHSKPQPDSNSPATSPHFHRDPEKIYLFGRVTFPGLKINNCGKIFVFCVFSAENEIF